VKDVREIGTPIGLGGSVRSAVSSVASAIYIAVLTNRLTTTSPARVVPTIVGAGLPQSSISSYFEAVAAGTAEGVCRDEGYYTCNHSRWWSSL
jgi:hypothetical protein